MRAVFSPACLLVFTLFLGCAPIHDVKEVGGELNKASGDQIKCLSAYLHEADPDLNIPLESFHTAVDYKSKGVQKMDFEDDFSKVIVVFKAKAINGRPGAPPVAKFAGLEIHYLNKTIPNPHTKMATMKATIMTEDNEWIVPTDLKIDNQSFSRFSINCGLHGQK